MSGEEVDFAIFGSSPLAGLLAGLLSTVHKRRVVMVGEPQARYRLPRALDLSVAPLTRPETWSLLAGAVPETAKLIGKIGGRHGLRRVDPVFFADSLAAREALGHFSHMARAHGLILEAVPPSRIGAGRLALRINDAITINRPGFEPAVDAWLNQAGIRRVLPDAATLAPGGTAEIRIGEAIISARHAVLLDDAAIMRHLSGWQWPAPLVRRPHASILTASSKHLAGPVMLQFDTGAVLVQHEEGGMAAMGPGTLGAFSRQLAALLAEAGQLQQVGQVGFDSLMTRDGAPLFGPAPAEGPHLLTGLGPTGAFLAPVLARWLTGEATAEETDWCEARRADKRGLGRSVAEFSTGIDELAA